LVTDQPDTFAHDVLTVPEAARRLRISKTHAHRLANAGELPGAFKLGHRTVVSKYELDRYLRSTKRPARPRHESAVA
jgi:excisionase family DNA binding protein